MSIKVSLVKGVGGMLCVCVSAVSVWLCELGGDEVFGDGKKRRRKYQK